MFTSNIQACPGISDPVHRVVNWNSWKAPLARDQYLPGMPGNAPMFSGGEREPWGLPPAS